MRVGIFGGSFDPVHYGHLITAQFIMEIRQLSKIIFIPNYVSPLRTNEKHGTSFHRLNMLKLALQDTPNFDFSDFEIINKEISYTINTVKHFDNLYNTVSSVTRQKIDLIVGYDNLVVFDKWKSPDEIIQLANLVVLPRIIEDTNRKDGDLVPTISTMNQHAPYSLQDCITDIKNVYFNKAVFVKTPIVEISSTMIRERIKQNLPINYLVPANVNNYIIKNKLYTD